MRMVSIAKVGQDSEDGQYSQGKDKIVTMVSIARDRTR